MPYNVYTYENVSMGAASIQSALDILKDEDKQQFLYKIENWDCILSNGMYHKMIDLIKYFSPRRGVPPSLLQALAEREGEKGSEREGRRASARHLG